MWQNGDELDIEVETTTDIFSSDTDATEDEVLDDAPPEIPAKPNIVSGFNSGVRLLEGCLDKIRNRREPAAKDHTLQAWLQEGRGQGGQPTAYDQWLEGHYGLRVKDFALWEESQRRLLEELEAGLYSKYCEAEKARVQAERERARQEQQPWQVQHCQPFRQPQPQPQPAQPTSPTHADKLSTLLSRTANLKHALSDARDLVVQQDRRPSLGGAERSHQPPRTAEIEAFFAALATAIDSAAARLDAFLGQARKRKLAGGCFQWIPSAETDFCAAWEGVVEAYRAVWNLQQRVVVEQQEHAAAAAEKDDDVWEWYLAALAWFGKRVRVIGEGGWC
ncbi:hypothetical protein N658DRAFT_500908 [Parathielavia hyrcaniae]|uniref:Uncharacterized protein n=1 Tax=Parathielavia hyrcaniae TaxID=113614 RepID=A0AAN6SY28_9PEZI|nr:hypothetical protein N658DRAFT_500908 [Parathielavia hyrcaniae]